MSKEREMLYVGLYLGFAIGLESVLRILRWFAKILKPDTEASNL